MAIKFQMVKPVSGAGAVKDLAEHILGDEEKQAAGLGLGLTKVGSLAEILGGQGRHPKWLGRGWSGEISADPTNSVQVSDALTDGARTQTKVHAWSFIFACNKGVSLLAAADAEVATAVAEAMELAVAEYVRVLEANCVVRLGRSGCDRVGVAGLKVWSVCHAASAAGDPHRHAHLIVSANAPTIDGRRGQIDGRGLLARHAKLADAAAQFVMERELKKIGIRIGLDGDVVGLDRDLREKASVARSAVQAIQAAFEIEGRPISDEQAWKHWRQIAEGKEDKALSASLVESIRKARGNLDPAEMLERAMDEMLSNSEKQSAVRQWLGKKYGLKDFAGIVKTARDAAQLEPDFDPVTRVIGLMAGLNTPPNLNEVEALCVRIVGPDEAVTLMEELGKDPRVLVGAKHFVLRSQLETERRIVARAEVLLGVGGEVDEVLASFDARFVVVSGVAGGGKTRALATARLSWQWQNLRVFATSRNSLTAADTGLAAGAAGDRSISTAALRGRLAREEENVPRAGDVLVVDEFGLLDHADIEMLLSLAEQGVYIKALGDSHQIQPIDHSTSARIVMDLASSKGMPSLDETKRCALWRDLHDDLREVVVKEADPAQVLDQMDIRCVQSVAEIAAIAASEPGSEIAVRSNLMRCDVAEALDRPEMPVRHNEVAILRDGIAGWRDDKVVVRRNVRVESVGGGIYQLKNGQRGTICVVGESEVELELADGKRVKLDKETAKDTLALGGVYTGDSAQGQTWGKSIVVVTGNETREWLYSAATRGREAPIFVVLAESGEEASSAVTTVLSREGVARTVLEMAKTDPTLMESIRRSDAVPNSSSAVTSGDSTQVSTLTTEDTSVVVDTVEAGTVEAGTVGVGTVVIGTDGTIDSFVHELPEARQGEVKWEISEELLRRKIFDDWISDSTPQKPEDAGAADSDSSVSQRNEDRSTESESMPLVNADAGVVGQSSDVSRPEEANVEASEATSVDTDKSGDVTLPEGFPIDEWWTAGYLRRERNRMITWGNLAVSLYRDELFKAKIERTPENLLARAEQDPKFVANRLRLASNFNAKVQSRQSLIEQYHLTPEQIALVDDLASGDSDTTVASSGNDQNYRTSPSAPQAEQQQQRQSRGFGLGLHFG